MEAYETYHQMQELLNSQIKAKISTKNNKTHAFQHARRKLILRHINNSKAKQIEKY